MSRTFLASQQSLQKRQRRESKPAAPEAHISDSLWPQEKPWMGQRVHFHLCLLEWDSGCTKHHDPKMIGQSGGWRGLATPPAWGTGRGCSRTKWVQPFPWRKVSMSGPSSNRTGGFTVTIHLWTGLNSKAVLFLQGSSYWLLSATFPHLWLPYWFPLPLFLSCHVSEATLPGKYGDKQIHPSSYLTNVIEHQ